MTAVGLAVDHRAGEFAARHEGLGQHDVAMGPVRAADLLRGVAAVRLDDDDADRGSLVDGLQHIGRRQDVALGRLVAVAPSGRGRPGCRPPP